jgi:hypothetical protein
VKVKKNVPRWLEAVTNTIAIAEYNIERRKKATYILLNSRSLE